MQLRCHHQFIFLNSILLAQVMGSLKDEATGDMHNANWFAMAMLGSAFIVSLLFMSREYKRLQYERAQ